MGSARSKFVPDINTPIPIWNRPNFPPIIAVYDQVNLDFRLIEGQKNTWKYDLPRLLAIFQGFNISRIVSIERQVIEVKDDLEYYDKDGWTSKILERKFYEDDYENKIVAVYYRTNDNMYGGNLLIDSELSGTPYPQKPIYPTLIEVVPGRCVVLRGDIRHKIQNWRRSSSQALGIRECFIIVAE